MERSAEALEKPVICPVPSSTYTVVMTITQERTSLETYHIAGDRLENRDLVARLLMAAQSLVGRLR